MVAKNEHTGDLMISKPSKLYEENYEAIFGSPKKVQRGKWIYCPETNELIPASEYKRPEVQRGDFPLPMLSLYEPGRSPVTGEWLETKRQMREDMKRHDCREYEGFESEQRAADAYKQAEQVKFDADLGEAIEKTAMDLKYNRTERSEAKAINIFE